MSNLKIITYNQLEDKNLFFKFCQQASHETTQPAHKNMWTSDWESNPDTLIYQIHNRHRYFDSSGDFHLALDGEVIVACSGVYKSSFYNEVAIGGCRTWVSKEYRHLGLPRELFLPLHKKWAIENNCKVIAITFNDYNKNLIETFKRKRFGEHRTVRQSHHLFYNNFNEVNFPVTVQYTKQWIVYEVLDLSFNFNWNSIEYLD